MVPDALVTRNNERGIWFGIRAWCVGVYPEDG